jgi:hypothetical protein
VYSIVEGARDSRAVLANCAWHVRKNNRDALAYARFGCTLVLLSRAAEAEGSFTQLLDLVPEARPYLGLVLDGLHNHQQQRKVSGTLQAKFQTPIS